MVLTVTPGKSVISSHSNSYFFTPDMNTNKGVSKPRDEFFNNLAKAGMKSSKLEDLQKLKEEH